MIEKERLDNSKQKDKEGEIKKERLDRYKSREWNVSKQKKKERLDR